MIEALLDSNPQLNMILVYNELLQQALHLSWLDGGLQVEGREAQGELHNSVLDWQMLNPNPGWDNISVTIKCGEEVGSLVEIVSHTNI